MSDMITSLGDPQQMKARLTIRAGQRGTKRLTAQYGDRLVCVRYRYDAQRRKRLKTVELIVEETDWTPAPGPPAPDVIVAVRIDVTERALQKTVKASGGRPN